MINQPPTTQSTATGSIAGGIDGTNRTFALSGPQQTACDIFWNGALLTIGVDFSITGNVFVLLGSQPPQPGDLVSARVWTQ